MQEMDMFAEKFMQDGDGREAICNKAEAAAKEIASPEYAPLISILVY